MQILQFLKKQSPYNAGEIAGFDDTLAERLIKAGIAKLAPPKPKEETTGDAGPLELLTRQRDLLLRERDGFVAQIRTLHAQLAKLGVAPETPPIEENETDGAGDKPVHSPAAAGIEGGADAAPQGEASGTKTPAAGKKPAGAK